MKSHFRPAGIKKKPENRKSYYVAKETEPLDYNFIQRGINAIIDSRDKALFAALYGTAARVSEISELKKENIKEEGDFCILTIPNRKHRINRMKSIPIPKTEDWLVTPITFWKDTNPLQTFMFNIGERQIRKLCHFYFKTNPHTLRHSRLTHLMQYYRMDLERLRMIAGWTDLSPARVYLHLRYQELFKGFEKR